MLRLFLPLFLLAVSTISHPSFAQTDVCTMVATGTSQTINVFSDCKHVTNNSGTTVCAVSHANAAQWQSFYNNPPAGVTIGSCAVACSLPWGGSISHGQSTTAWNTSASCGGCSSETRSCNNGTLSGSFTNQSCNNNSCCNEHMGSPCTKYSCGQRSVNAFCFPQQGPYYGPGSWHLNSEYWGCGWGTPCGYGVPGSCQLGASPYNCGGYPHGDNLCIATFWQCDAIGTGYIQCDGGCW